MKGKPSAACRDVDLQFYLQGELFQVNKTFGNYVRNSIDMPLDVYTIYSKEKVTMKLVVAVLCLTLLLAVSDAKPKREIRAPAIEQPWKRETERDLDRRVIFIREDERD
ncbi:hypothetical protein BgiMline_031790, partial [Biomphalaria glabrata]